MAEVEKAGIDAQPAEPTEAELMAELQSALSKGDFKAVASVSRKIDGVQKAKEKAELEAKKAILDKITDKVKAVILKAVKPLVDAKELDEADGIWFNYDFGEQAPTVRLMRTAPRAARAGGGGGGKKFDVSTTDLVTKHATEEFKDGITFAQAYELNTDKNWRYAIRQKLLKLEGIV